MPFVAHSAPSIRFTPAESKPSLLVRSARTIIQARTRMYLEAITDPTTSRIDPELEQRVLHLMAL
jgi:hypothetical protein